MKESTLEVFKLFYSQIYNGGIEQPICWNRHYSDDVLKVWENLGTFDNIVDNICRELTRELTIEEKSILDQFVRNVCTVCEASENAIYYKSCSYCGGSGYEYETNDEDEEECNTCGNCGGEGEVRCTIDDLDDPSDARTYMNYEGKSAWDWLDNFDSYSDELDIIWELKNKDMIKESVDNPIDWDDFYSKINDMSDIYGEGWEDEINHNKSSEIRKAATERGLSDLDYLNQEEFFDSIGEDNNIISIALGMTRPEFLDVCSAKETFETCEGGDADRLAEVLSGMDDSVWEATDYNTVQEALDGMKPFNGNKFCPVTTKLYRQLRNWAKGFNELCDYLGIPDKLSI